MQIFKKVFSKKALLSFIVVLILFLASLVFLTGHRYEGYQTRFLRCLDLGPENWYENDPYCVQAPMIYLVGYLMQFFFGQDNLQLVSKLLTIVLSIAIYFISLLIIEKETGRKPYFVFLLLFVPFIFYPLQGYLEMTLTTFFLILGFYVLFYTQHKYKELIAGLGFSLSLLSKMSSMYLVLLFILIYHLRIRLEPSGLTVKIINKSASLIIGTVSAIFIFLHIKPNAYKYLFVLPKLFVDAGLSYHQAAKVIISLFFQNILFIFPLSAIVLLNIYGLAKYRQKIFLVLIPFLLALGGVVKALGHFSDSKSYYYIIPYFLFFIIGLALMVIKEQLTSVKIAAVILIIVAVLSPLVIFRHDVISIEGLKSSQIESKPIFKGLSTISLVTFLSNDHEGEKLRRLMENPFLLIPKQKGEVLLAVSMTEEDYRQGVFLQYFDHDLVAKADKLPWEIDPDAHIDWSWWQHDKLADLIGGKERILAKWTPSPEQLEQHRQEKERKFSEIKQKMFNYSYDLIIVVHPVSLDIAAIIDGSYFTSRYIYLYVPNKISPSGYSKTLLMFKSSSDAEKIKVIADYNNKKNLPKIKNLLFESDFLFIFSDLQRLASVVIVLFLFLIMGAAKLQKNKLQFNSLMQELSSFKLTSVKNRALLKVMMLKNKTLLKATMVKNKTARIITNFKKLSKQNKLEEDLTETDAQLKKIENELKKI